MQAYRAKLKKDARCGHCGVALPAGVFAVYYVPECECTFCSPECAEAEGHTGGQ